MKDFSYKETRGSCDISTQKVIRSQKVLNAVENYKIMPKIDLIINSSQNGSFCKLITII